MSVGRSFRAVLIAVLAAGAARRRAAVASAACPKGAQCATRDGPARPHAARPRARSRWPTPRSRRPARGRARSSCSAAAPASPRSRSPSRSPGCSSRCARSYDIVTVDQRGTGDSGAVVVRRSPGRDDVAACAAKLGDRRAFFNTPETARDLEDLRVALGVDKLTLLGVSYGAKVASEYARRYPAQTAALVLDSPAPVDGLDGFDQLRTLGTPRVLREVCFPGPCHATVTDPDEALTAAASRLQDGAIRGPLVSSSRTRAGPSRVTESDLYSALLGERPQPGAAPGPAGRDRLARRRRRRAAAASLRARRLRRCRQRRASTARGCWPRRASRRDCRGRRTPRSPRARTR